MRVCERALERGVFAQAIRPPTVPAGTSRLRLAAMASHTPAELRERPRSVRRPRRARPARARRAGAEQSAARAGCSTAAASARGYALALRGALRHRHRHRGRQDGRGRGDRAPRWPRAASGWPLQAGGDRPRRARPGVAARPRAAARSARRAQQPEEVAPLPLRPAGLAAPRRRAGRRADRAGASCVAAARGARRGRRRRWSCEGVGGLLVPLTPGYLVRDLARRPRRCRW